ncbi:putative inactive poly [ADP-ribose] polymerase SRO1 [Zea mays]|nr:putative inactive poly [ADP-ribose] polymerase SRO1 [Zea mays]
MGSVIESKDIIGIYRTPLLDDHGQVRYHIHQKQVQVTGCHRGNANVRYAWLPCSKSTVHVMMLNGVLQVDKPPNKCAAYGEGTLLTPANRSDAWYVLDISIITYMSGFFSPPFLKCCWHLTLVSSYLCFVAIHIF